MGPRVIKSDFFSVTEWEVANDGKNDNPHILPIDTLWSVNKRGEFFFQIYLYFVENSQKP